jgi:hypothetical protein
VTRLVPPKAERRTLLRERGWVRTSRRGCEGWQHPRFARPHFGLAAAYQAKLEPAFMLLAGERNLLFDSEDLIGYARRLWLERKFGLSGVLVGDGSEEPE